MRQTWASHQRIRRLRARTLAALIVATSVMAGLSDKAFADPPWKAHVPPLPANAPPNSLSYLSYISCPRVTCVAVGGYTETSGAQEALVESLSNGSWSAKRAPLPPNAVGAPAGLEEVTCPQPGSCEAIGNYTVDLAAGYTGTGLFERLSGGTWKAEEAPLPPSTGDNQFSGYLQSITCASTRFCVAVGEYGSHPTIQEGLLETLSGTTWSASEAPLPTNAEVPGPEVYLTSTGCESVDRCIAAGIYKTTSGQWQGLLEVRSHGAWKDQEAPLPRDALRKQGAQVLTAACGSHICEALGTYFPKGDMGSNLFADSLSATTWTASVLPLPSDSEPAPNATIGSIDCGSPASCVATGSYMNTRGREEGIFESLSGSTWTAIVAVAPSDAAKHSGVGLSAVICDKSRFCVASGFYSDSSHNQPALVESLSPKHIVTATRLNAPAHFGSLSLPSVAHESGSSFALVGTFDSAPEGVTTSLVASGIETTMNS
jgi:hypothetical protein